MKLIKYLSGIFKGVWSLMVGMKVTMSYFLRPWTIVTQQYPENRRKRKRLFTWNKENKLNNELVMFDRFRGELLMPHNEKNEHKCTGCGICEINCPNGTIEVISKQIVSEDGKKKRAIDKHIWRMGMCAFCSLCVKTCPSSALVWGQDFEQAVFDRKKLNKVLNKEGSTLMKGVE
jgi:NADH-quinone oxidoreductase subunit I